MVGSDNMTLGANQIIDHYGIRIAYIRSSTYFRCPYKVPWSGYHKTTDGMVCPLCLGTGKIVSSETRIVRKSSTQVEVPANSGIPKRIDLTWYFKNNVNIKSGDYIVECRWHGTFPSIKPTGIVDIFRIDDIDTYTKEFGRGLVYSRAFTTKIVKFNEGPWPASDSDDERSIILHQLTHGIKIIE